MKFNKLSKILFSIIMSILLLGIINQNILCFAAESPNIDSVAGIVYDINTGEILFSKNMDSKLYPASTTKILTCLLALENLKLDDTIVFDANAVKLEPNSSTLHFTSGEETNVKNALYGLMVKSANEIANQFALEVERKQNLSFNEIAAERLKNLGATNSNFISPSGLHQDDHYTTVHDMALIAAEAYRNENFKKIVSTQSYTIPKTNKHEERKIYNTHSMLYKTSPYYLPYVVGGKTGTTDQAGRTLVTFAEKDGFETVTVIFKATDDTMACSDTYKLINYAYENFSCKKVYKKGDTLSLIPVYNSKGVLEDNLKTVANEDIYITIKKKDGNDTFVLIPQENEYFSITFNLPLALYNGVLKDYEVGNITITSNSGYKTLIKLYSQNDVKIKVAGKEGDNTILYAIIFVLISSFLAWLIFNFFKLNNEEKNI